MNHATGEVELRFEAVVQERSLETECIIITEEELRKADLRIAKSTSENDRARNRSVEAAAHMYTGS